MTEGDEQLSSPSKELLDQEKQLLLSFKPVMQKFLHEHVELQVGALYALQVHCNANGFPKGEDRSCCCPRGGTMLSRCLPRPRFHGVSVAVVYVVWLMQILYMSVSPGMLLRYFVSFYDMEIIEEEAFLAWKEDITQEFPGKGKALFQVRCECFGLCPCLALQKHYYSSFHLSFCMH